MARQDPEIALAARHDDHVDGLRNEQPLGRDEFELHFFGHDLSSVPSGLILRQAQDEAFSSGPHAELVEA
jgi:hypothetical protein